VKTVSALEVRKRFGQILDQAAGGERIVVERAGQPVAAIVPLADLRNIDPDLQVNLQLEAIEDIRRLARQYPIDIPDTVALIRQMREERTQQILRAVRGDQEGSL
jgi:prevent-host-death family protein